MFLWIPGVNGLLGAALAKQARGFCLGTGREAVDISNLASVREFVRKNPGITHIVNCAAFSQVDLSETHPEEARKANALGPENLALAAKEIGARLVHISTDYVFEGNLHRPLREEDPTQPVNTYGKTKLEGEERVLHALPEACVLRVSWIFGAGGKNFVAKLLHLLQTQKEIRLTNDHWSRPTYAPDLASVILQMLDHSGIYHFANAGVANKYEFGIAMKEEAELLGLPIVSESIIPVPGSAFPSPCKRPVFSAFDTGKIERELCLTPRHWRTALKEYLCSIF